MPFTSLKSCRSTILNEEVCYGRPGIARERGGGDSYCSCPSLILSGIGALIGVTTELARVMEWVRIFVIRDNFDLYIGTMRV